ncbi:MAG: hypothetical protein AUG10_03980 [Gemmatimonadetes bacterium 13_1_20CM_2_70_10]|nr:MAG: hypothetical protein AUG10_03980 [Gemmatimonadetes bacterium 13_1_20CM_2_70_10]
MSSLVFHLIAHTHWDREWYLPRAALHARLVPALDDLVTRLTADPAYRTFLLDGQTILLEDYVRARPDREADVKALVKTNRLQVGPWYVLADEQIPSGESLVRNLLFGAADADHWGGRSEALYSPDAFGHPAVWPSLAREFGIRAGVLWRGLGGEPGQERDLYRWRGRDGQEAIVWHLSPEGYEIGAALPADAERLAVAWPPVREALVARAASKHVAVFVGADHHAAHPELPRLRDLLAALEPDYAVRISRVDEFLSLAGADAAKAAPLAGELRWSYRYAWTLQGVHGTRAPQKRRHARAELWLERHAEPLAALARRRGGADRRPLLETAWRTLLACQFHDTIGGCVSDTVAAETEVRLAAVESYAQEVARASLDELAGHDPDAARERAEDAAPALVLWNPAARSRGGVVIADAEFFRRDVVVGPPAGRQPRVGPGYRAFALAGLDGPPPPLSCPGRGGRGARGVSRAPCARSGLRGAHGGRAGADVGCGPGRRSGSHAYKPARRGDVRSDRRAGPARSPQRRAILRRAALGGRRRCRRHLHLLPARARPPPAEHGADRRPAARGGAVGRRPGGALDPGPAVRRAARGGPARRQPYHSLHPASRQRCD